MDIYNMSGFQWWCKQRRKSSFLALAFTLFFLVIFGSGFASSLKTNNVSNANIDNGAIGMLVLMFIVFIIMILSVLRAVIRNMNIKVDEYWSGTVTNFYIKRYGSSSNRKRRLYIVANVNGKELDAQCMSTTYRNAQVGQQIVVFTIKGSNRLHCVHPEM